METEVGVRAVQVVAVLIRATGAVRLVAEGKGKERRGKERRGEEREERTGPERESERKEKGKKRKGQEMQRRWKGFGGAEHGQKL